MSGGKRRANLLYCVAKVYVNLKYIHRIKCLALRRQATKSIKYIKPRSYL